MMHGPVNILPWRFPSVTQYVVSELLRSLIAFQLFSKRVEDVPEEGCYADGIYVCFWHMDLTPCLGNRKLSVL